MHIYCQFCIWRPHIGSLKKAMGTVFNTQKMGTCYKYFFSRGPMIKHWPAYHGAGIFILLTSSLWGSFTATLTKGHCSSQKSHLYCFPSFWVLHYFLWFTNSPPALQVAPLLDNLQLSYLEWTIVLLRVDHLFPAVTMVGTLGKKRSHIHWSAHTWVQGRMATHAPKCDCSRNWV